MKGAYAGILVALVVLLVVLNQFRSESVNLERPSPPGDSAERAEPVPELTEPKVVTEAEREAAVAAGKKIAEDSAASRGGFQISRFVEPALILKQLAGAVQPELRVGRRVPVAAGKAPERVIAEFVRQGLGEVRGTVELKTDRKPKLEEGMPVALSGTVTEEGSGKPIEGAEVILRSAFYTRALFYDHHLREVARAVTDFEGNFSIERLNVDPVHFGKGGKVYLSVGHDDYAPLLAVPLSGVTPGYRNRFLKLELPAEHYVVTGQVVDYWESKPVAGGRVVATGEIDPIQYPKDQREALFLSAPETKTDEEGRFTLTHVGRGRQWISVHGGNDCAGRLMVTVPLKGEVKILSRQLRGRIAGRVLDEYDRPISLVKIDGGENTTHSFGDGSFLLENFRGDVVTVVFTHVDYRTLPVKEVKDGERELLVRLMSKWPKILFRVISHEKGKPIRKVKIELTAAKGTVVPIPASPFYLSKKGVHAVRIPDGVVEATISTKNREPFEIDLAGARDGDTLEVILRRN